MAKKKDMFSEQTHIAYPNEDLVISKSATVYCGRPARLEAHGKSKELTRKAVGIGRDKQNMIIVADPRVSKFHAVLTFKRDGAYIKDTGSTNGTSVNGEGLVRNKERKLNAGDEVVVGSTRIQIRY